MMTSLSRERRSSLFPRVRSETYAGPAIPSCFFSFTTFDCEQSLTLSSQCLLQRPSTKAMSVQYDELLRCQASAL